MFKQKSDKEELKTSKWIDKELEFYKDVQDSVINLVLMGKKIKIIIFSILKCAYVSFPKGWANALNWENTIVKLTLCATSIAILNLFCLDKILT